jgi:hypothetical protein
MSFLTSRRRSSRLQQGLQRKIFIMKLVVFLKAEGRSKTWTRLELLNFMINVIRCLLNLISLSNYKTLERMTQSDSMMRKANRNWLSDLKRLQDHPGPQLIFLTSLGHQNIKRLSRNKSQSQNSHLLFQHNKRNPADLWKNHQMKAANQSTNNTDSKAMCVSIRDQIQRTTRHSALNKPVVVVLSRSKGMKTQEPSRSNSIRDNSNNKTAVVLNIMMTNTKVKMTLKMIYPKSINSKCKSTGRKTNKHQTQKATPQKSTKK